MRDHLSYEQYNEIKAAIQQGASLDDLIQKLEQDGYDKETAITHIRGVIKDYKQELFERAKDKQKNEEWKKGAMLAVFFLTVIGPVFDIANPVWYIFAGILACVAAYYGYKDKPAGAIVGALCMVITFPFAYNLYFSGRSSYIRIEMLIPLFMAAIPSFVLMYTISRLAYPKEEEY